MGGKEEARLAEKRQELRDQRPTGDRVADAKIRERIEQDIRVAAANARDTRNR